MSGRAHWVGMGCCLTLVRRLAKAVLVAGLTVGGIGVPAPAAAYSVLAHEANIDALWDPTMKVLLLARYPDTTPDQLLEARAYAYGGCVIQDLGYYPFGSHFFSNLLHYVRTGDFVEALLGDARDVDEYAFALGALAHYAADTTGHPLAVNRSVALMYPKLALEYGPSVTYEESPKSHVLVEFSFDVVQVAAGAYAPEAYHSYIGFKVAKPALERAFQEVYGIEMKEIFLSEDTAIATYRHAVATTIPEMTKVAWGKKRAQIMAVTPGAKRQTFVFHLSTKQYDAEFGRDYATPHGFARFLGFVYRLLPKIGPFRSLGFSVPTAEAERLFLASFVAARERFRHALDAVGEHRLRLANADLDTGRPTARGEYALADATYDELLDKLARHEFEGVPPALRADILAHYGGTVPPAPPGKGGEARIAKVRSQLGLLESSDGGR